MQTGNVFIAHPSNDEQLNALKAFLKALKIKFEVTNLENSYKPEFVAKIKKSKQEFDDGKFTRVEKDNLQDFLGI